MHAHFQIEYVKEGGTVTESLVGFDPRKQADRSLLYDCLDEYLDNYLIPKLNGEVRDPGNSGFRVFNSVHEE